MSHRKGARSDPELLLNGANELKSGSKRTQEDFTTKKKTKKANQARSYIRISRPYTLPKPRNDLMQTTPNE